MGKVNLKKWEAYTVVVDRKLAEKFRKACKSRGRKQNLVIQGAMKYYLAHPYAKAWTTLSYENGSVSRRVRSAPRRVKGVQSSS